MEKLSKKALKEQYKNRAIIGGIYCIKCSGNNAIWLRKTTDMKGAENRFGFSVSINSYPEACMREAWKMYGAAAFSFEILEEIQKEDSQTQPEFLEDINILLALWTEKQKEK